MAKRSIPQTVSEKIAPAAVEISVAKSGFLKPYMACFNALPDNIAREPLGMLAGVFLIGDRSEDSAYIVNFLSSLAKKEYYGNPRRSAIESFESCLHKINLGLSELAKEGNTEWIGTLDAALLAIERNNLHFSVAGKSSVLLLRDHRLSVISDGLAEEGECHPMKTFTDVASGKICSGDTILLTTPELFSAVSEAELERAAARLSREELERFLQTVIVNRLDLSATILVDIRTVEEYRRPLAPKKSAPASSSIPNAWSLSSFEISKQKGTSIEAELRERKESEKEKERIDEKTGHIYVTGDTPIEGANETWMRTRELFVQCHAFFSKNGVAAWRKLEHECRKMSAKISSFFKNWRVRRSSSETQEINVNEFSKSSAVSPTTPLPSQKENAFLIITRNTVRLIRAISLPRFSEKPAIHLPVHEESESRNFGKTILLNCQELLRSSHSRWNALSGKTRKILIGCASASILILLLFSLFSADDTPEEETLPSIDSGSSNDISPE